MVRQTFLKKAVDYVRQDEFIGLNSYKKRVTAVVYKGPYLDSSENFSDGIPICTGEISSGLDTYIILMDRSLSQTFQGFIKGRDKDPDASPSEKEIKRRIEFYKSSLTEKEMNALKNTPSTDKSPPEDLSSTAINRLAAYQGFWAFKNTYRMPKSILGPHKIDFIKSPGPTVIFDISTARSSGPKSMSNISIVSIVYTDLNDIRGTDIVPSGVSAYIKDADVNDANSVAKNLQNGIGAVLNDDCNKRTIELRKVDAEASRRSLR